MEYWQWHGSSIVPGTVYHGTRSRKARKIRYAKSQDIGIHVGSREQATHRAGTTGRVIPLRIRLERPLRLPDLGTWNPQVVVIELLNRGLASRADADRIMGAENRHAAVRRFLKSKGYDGIVYRNEVEGRGDSYLLFDDNQLWWEQEMRQNPGPKPPSPKTRKVVDVMIDLMKKRPNSSWHPSIFTGTMPGYRGNIAPAIRYLKSMGMIEVDYINVEGTKVYKPSPAFLEALGTTRSNPAVATMPFHQIKKLGKMTIIKQGPWLIIEGMGIVGAKNYYSFSKAQSAFAKISSERAAATWAARRSRKGVNPLTCDMTMPEIIDETRINRRTGKKRPVKQRVAIAYATKRKCKRRNPQSFLDRLYKTAGNRIKRPAHAAVSATRAVVYLKTSAGYDFMGSVKIPKGYLFYGLWNESGGIVTIRGKDDFVFKINAEDVKRVN